MQEKSIIEIKAEILDLIIEKDAYQNRIKWIENAITEKFALINNPPEEEYEEEEVVVELPKQGRKKG